jgi:NADH-quinone oxidoreductase subunit C
VSDETLYGCPVSESRGQTVIHPTRTGYVDAVKAATDDGFTMCVDLTAVDYLRAPTRDLPDGVSPERFEVAVSLLDMANRRRLRVRVQVPAADATVPTLFDVHPGTEAMEREVFDMYGITFEGHPDLTRILMPEDWEGHPLRKDYVIGAIPVQFKGAPS